MSLYRTNIRLEFDGVTIEEGTEGVIHLSLSPEYVWFVPRSMKHLPAWGGVWTKAKNLDRVYTEKSHQDVEEK